MLRVEGDRSLASIDPVEQGAHRVALRTELAEAVADTIGQLDLDHLGALLGEDHAGHRRRDHLRSLDHSDSSEGLHHEFLGVRGGAVQSNVSTGLMTEPLALAASASLICSIGNDVISS